MRADVWEQGDGYEGYVGRWSRMVATEFLDWLDVEEGRRWLDVGCGTGILSQAVLTRSNPTEVRGIDASEAFVDHGRHHVDDPRFEARVGDAMSLPFEDESFDAVVTGLTLNFVDDPGAAAAELARVATPGAVVGAYLWDYGAGMMQMIRFFWDVAKELDPAAETLDEAARFAEIASMKGLGHLFDIAGLTEVRTRAIDVPTVFRDFDDYWTPFLSGQGPAPAYCMSLDEGARSELREMLRARLPEETDGTIRLTARAWAVKGMRPAIAIASEDG